MKKTITEGRFDEQRIKETKNKIRVKVKKGMKKTITQDRFDGNKNKTRNKKIMKKTLTEDRFDENKIIRKKEKNKDNEKEKEININTIEIKLRNLLFKNKRPIGGNRNHSVERRKKVEFALD